MRFSCKKNALYIAVFGSSNISLANRILVFSLRRCARSLPPLHFQPCQEVVCNELRPGWILKTPGEGGLLICTPNRGLHLKFSLVPTLITGAIFGRCWVFDVVLICKLCMTIVWYQVLWCPVSPFAQNTFPKHKPPSFSSLSFHLLWAPQPKKDSPHSPAPHVFSSTLPAIMEVENSTPPVSVSFHLGRNSQQQKLLSRFSSPRNKKSPYPKSPSIHPSIHPIRWVPWCTTQIDWKDLMNNKFWGLLWFVWALDLDPKGVVSPKVRREKLEVTRGFGTRGAR